MNHFELPAPQDDGLCIPDVGPWSRDKHHFVRRYLDAFTTSMREKWLSLHYVDLFAGAGIEHLEEKGRSYGLDWGSPLLAAQVPFRFTRLHLVEKDDEKREALRLRLAKYPQPESPQLVDGDANVVVDAILKEIPSYSLSLVFLDPYGLHLPFTTLEKLSHRRADLIIFFPDHVDALRNWRVYYEDDRNSNLDQVLGNAPWREEKQRTSPDRWADLLSRLYVSQIAKLGYRFFEYERICRTDGVPLYKLIFCSKDTKGAVIWRNVARRKRDGQDSFAFE